jgi:hypothetical protein
VAPLQQKKSSPPLMLKPGLGPRGARSPVVQRTIVGLEGQQIWRTEIAGKVANEDNSSVRDEIHRLHNSNQLVPVASYEDLVGKIKSGYFSSSAAQNPALGQNIQGIAQVFAQLRDDPSVLGKFPQVAALYNTQQDKWRTKGVREVLHTFIFLYANADALGSAFEKTDQSTDRAFLLALNHFCINFLGCPVTGERENEKLTNVEMLLGTWLKEGLEKTEEQLTKYSSQPEKYNDYVTDNLDNDTKAYFRKLESAMAAPKEFDKSDRMMGGLSQQQQYEVFLRQVPRMGNQLLYLGLLWDYMKDARVPLTFETMKQLVDDTIGFAEKVKEPPSESDIRQFLSPRLAKFA